jgi:hypothetical protein
MASAPPMREASFGKGLGGYSMTLNQTEISNSSPMSWHLNQMGKQTSCSNEMSKQDFGYFGESDDMTREESKLEEPVIPLLHLSPTRRPVLGPNHSAPAYKTSLAQINTLEVVNEEEDSHLLDHDSSLIKNTSV